MSGYSIDTVVICIRCGDHPHLVGEVGIITNIVPTAVAPMINADYDVQFFSQTDVPCPHCKKPHPKGEFAMLHSEIKPLEDPDAAEDRITEKDLVEELQ